MALSIKVDSSRLSKLAMTISVLWLMFSSMRLFFTWSVPVSLMMVFGIVSIVLYVLFNHLQTTRPRLILCLLLGVVFFYEVIRINEFSVLTYLLFLVKYVTACLILLSDTDFLKELLHITIKITAFICAISLLFWILFLIGVPLPHYHSETDSYYTHTVFYFFLLNGTPGHQIPRFAGLFLEPGHIGSTSCLLLFLNRFSLKKWENVVFLLSILLSLSLAAYGLLIGGFGLYLFMKSKKGILYIIPFALLLALMTVFFTNFKGGKNPINEKIIERLVFQDGELAGSNRTTAVFESKYARFIKTNKIWFGVGRDAFDYAGNNILNGCATWKRYYYLRGIVGSLFLLVFLFGVIYYYPSKLGLAFLILFLVCNMIRDYPLRELWLYLYLFAIPIFYEDKLVEQKIIA